MFAKRLVLNSSFFSGSFARLIVCNASKTISPVMRVSSVNSIKGFHTSSVVFAKAKKGGSSKNDDGEGVPMPELKPIDSKMDQMVAACSAELTKFRVGRATTETFNDIVVESYGTVASTGQITLKGPTKVSIAVYDPSMVKNVCDAIKSSGLGVNPSIEGNTIIVNMPKPSKEARDMMIKAASKVAEQVYDGTL